MAIIDTLQCQQMIKKLAELSLECANYQRKEYRHYHYLYFSRNKHDHKKIISPRMNVAFHLE